MRKTSQAALLALLEQELIERFDVETKVCPVLIELTAPDSNDDVKTEAVAVSLSLHLGKPRVRLENLVLLFRSVVPVRKIEKSCINLGLYSHFIGYLALFLYLNTGLLLI